MKANNTIISRLTPDILIRFMTSMSMSTTIARRRNPDLANDPEITQDNNDVYRQNNDGGSITNRQPENTVGNIR